ncbi:uncharacterized protein LOC134242906 [Saccostrea cucullata]|uniref:uncharacterized protein LOC134242906 n=1 Tax=Saccostrea cuccullata TaxID=36930 RepID=UPI002ED01AE2
MSLSADPLRRSSRYRTLTVPAQEEYEVRVETFQRKLSNIRNEWRECFDEIERSSSDARTLKSVDELLKKGFEAYEKESNSFCEYLRATRSEESANELASHLLIKETLLAKVNVARSRIERLMNQSNIPKEEDHMSQRSYRALTQRTISSSKASNRSMESILRQKEAKLEAHRTMLKHLDEELALEAQLKRFRAQREMKMVESELSVLKDEPRLRELAPSLSSRSKTEEYLKLLPRFEEERKKHEDVGQFSKTNSPKIDDSQKEAIVMSTPAQSFSSPSNDNVPRAQLNPEAQPFVPPGNGLSMIDVFTKHLVKRDLILSRLSTFDDNPMMFISWKMGFNGIMEELGATDTERLELLCEKLGPESSRQAKTIRACNASSPNIAIKKIWERLERRFGAAEQIENYILKKIKDFPEITSDHFHLLYDLADLASEIASLKSQPQFGVLFSYFDSKKGVNELVEKLPWNLKDKWTSEATKYKRSAGVTYPPFSVFLKFLENTAEMKNDPAFQFEKKGARKQSNFQAQQPRQTSGKFSVNKTFPVPKVQARKTEAISTNVSDMCPLHKNSQHSLNNCVPFRQKPIGERKKIILTNGICFKCCSGKKHRAKNCKADVKCSVCQASSHPTALHEESTETQDSEQYAVKDKRGNPYEGENVPTVSSACTKVHGMSKSCAKIVPVRVSTIANPRKSMVVYAIIDDQSNRSLATSSVFNYFKDDGGDVPYTLVSCTGTVSATGRFGTGYTVESLDGTCQLKFPELIECNDLPSNRDEIPSCQVATQYPHLKCIASKVPPLIETANIELLIGRDLTSAHIVYEQIVGEEDEPFAQRLSLGWVIVGQVCLGGAHLPEVRTFKTFALRNGRPSTFEPCNNELLVNDRLFQKTEHDEKIGLSIEDREFLKLMDTSFERDDSGHWVAPLPFKQNRPRLPDNKPQALQRARSFDKNLQHNPEKFEHVKEFMVKLFDRGHAEKAPVLEDDVERWYLPMFGVYHPKKPGSIRVVFDSSARYEGVSLNDSLMKGPDLSNNLQGVLMRFRLEKYAVMADVEQMFHNFRVKRDHRDYLRFLWHPNHDLKAPLEEFRMTVHVFGNSPSPSVATFGLRKSVSSADLDIQHFVSHNFYVDDGLMSFSTVSEAVDLLKRTQDALYDGGRLRLHKITSNSVEILQHFQQEDLSKDLIGLDIMQDNLPEQRSLGIAWNIETDKFIFRVNKEPRPYTRRGVLSVINSFFDPIGFTAPVTVVGKMLLRDAMTSKIGWDDLLPNIFQIKWEGWVDSLNALETVHIPCRYCQLSTQLASHLEVHIFSDASKEAVAAVAYLKVFHKEHAELGFLLGKAKVAPTHGHTIPRLELCASVLAVEMAEIIREQLQVSKDAFTFYTDSQVVLGYISNDAKRFHVYVSNRVSRIRSFCGPECWRYVMSEQNPADIATRGCSTRELPLSSWLLGPNFLRNSEQCADQPPTYDLVDPETDEEVRKQVTCSKTTVISQGSDSSQPRSMSTWCERFEKFSTWASLVRAITRLKGLLSRTKSDKPNTVALKEDAEHFIIKQTQNDRYSSEILAIKGGKHPPQNSSLIPLNPVLDQNGILRVGGRVKHMKISDVTTQPIIIPKDNHVATLLVRHYHEEVHHQGRHMTEGAIRSAGFWVVGFRRLVNSLIRSCVLCKKLRGNLGWTKMADLPLERVEPGPPFSFVGIDTFGPWPVVVKKTTRGVRTTSKYWAILFTCLVSRAVHIELVGDMSSEAFINALRRFMAIRGPVRQFRSDRGTNFIGAMKELGISATFDESGTVHDYLTKCGSTWVFNPPYAHHFGGAWERLIGSCRRILDALLLENRPKDLNFDVLNTFMSEVSAIMNTRPLLPISSDPEAPSVLSPSMILTQKGHNFSTPMNVTGFGDKDAMRSQWKLVQKLADDFWHRWRLEYIHCLQTRRKWQLPGTTFKVGDVVLVKDDSSHRNMWPVGVVDEVFPSKDDVIRKVKVTIVRDDIRTSYVRPITELIHLLDCE